MTSSRSLLLSALVALLCCVSSSVSVPHKQAGILGQEELGPIDNYTCPDEGLFPHDDCEYFITCWNKRPVLWVCTEEMLYDLRYNGCDYAENVDCGNRRRPPTYPTTRTPPTSSTTSTTPDPTAPTTTTSAPPNGTFDCQENGAFPHPDRCEYYWNCWEGEAFLMKCQLDYLFDLTYSGCNFPDMVDCGSRQRPPDSTTVSTTQGTTVSSSSTSRSSDDPSTTSSSGGTSSSTKNPPVDFQCPEPEGLFPDPEDCGAFYSCIGNIPIRDTCPDGLHFNPRSLSCDWPEEAGCSSHL